MKTKFHAVVSFVKNQSKKTKFIALGVVLAFVVSGSAFALTRPEPQQPVTQEPEQTQHEEHKTEEVAAATTETQPAPATTQPAQTATKPATKPKTGTKPASSTASDVPMTSTVKVPTPPTPPPSPTPTFYFVVDHYSLAQDPNYPNQAYIRFDLFRDPGHVGVWQQPQCSFTSVPAGGQGVTCFITQKEESHGYIALWIPDDAPLGDYIGQVTLNDGTVARTCPFGFRLSE